MCVCVFYKMQIKVCTLHEKHFIFYNIKMLLPGIKEIHSIIIAQDWDENGLLAISVILNKFPCKHVLNKSHSNEIILVEKTL